MNKGDEIVWESHHTMTIRGHTFPDEPLMLLALAAEGERLAANSEDMTSERITR